MARRSGISPRLTCPLAPPRAWGSSRRATLARRSRRYPRHLRPPRGLGRQATGPRPRRSTFPLACHSTCGSSAARSSAWPYWPPPSPSPWPGCPCAGSRNHQVRTARTVPDGATPGHLTSESATRAERRPAQAITSRAGRLLRGQFDRGPDRPQLRGKLVQAHGGRGQHAEGVTVRPHAQGHGARRAPLSVHARGLPT